METSSPLAALRPAPPTFGGQGDIFRSRAHTHYSNNPIRAGTFNFDLRDQFNLDLQRPTPGYFSLKAFGGINGSSPTVSLAADLSQNFSITESR